MCDEKVRLLDIAPVRLDDNYRSCMIFGWQSYVSPSAKVLARPVQYAAVVLNSWKICNYMFKGAYKQMPIILFLDIVVKNFCAVNMMIGNTSYSNVFCTMIEENEGVRACSGNPGSPVVCEDQHMRMVLLGIASWTNYSLDCGGLPSYLGVSVFRSWMYDLIYNDRKTEWETGVEANAGPCKRVRYLGGIYAETNSQNYNDSTFSLASSKQLRNEEKSIEKIVYGPDKTYSQEDNKPSLALNSRLVPPFSEREKINVKVTGVESFEKYPVINVVQERDEYLKQYKEIGKKNGPSTAKNTLEESNEQGTDKKPPKSKFTGSRRSLGSFDSKKDENSENNNLNKSDDKEEKNNVKVESKKGKKHHNHNPRNRTHDPWAVEIVDVDDVVGNIKTKGAAPKIFSNFIVLNACFCFTLLRFM